MFINCPFDNDYDPILQAMLFCVAYLGFTPRIARERNDSGESRLEKIKGLIAESRYSVHDLSRSKSRRRNEHARHNMPFELGLDYGCRQYSKLHAGKRFLILSEKQYDYLKSLSDLSGCDIDSHHGDFQIAMRRVRNWLVNDAKAPRNSSFGTVLAKYSDFQGWHYARQLYTGCTDDEIKDYPTKELFDATLLWLAVGEPPTFDPLVVATSVSIA